MAKSINQCDNQADTAIKTMVGACIAGSITPALINPVVVAGAMGVGVVSIGICYDVQVTKDEAWKLIKQFFLAAGTMFVMVNMGGKLLSIILSSTGVGYGGAVAMDAALSAAQAYAVGACAKQYFRQEFLGKAKPTTQELGQIFKEAFRKKKSESG